MLNPDPPRPELAGAEPPRPRVFAACLILAAVGLAVLLSVGFLVYATVQVVRQLDLNHAGTEPPPPAEEAPPAWPRPDPVTPTQLAADTDRIELPGEFDAVCRGAGGRYLFLRIPAAKQLVVFDPVEAKVVQRLELTAGGAPFAAGASKLYLFQNQRLQQFDLRTWEMKRESPLPPRGKVEALLTGSGTDGPVFAVRSGEAAVTAYSPQTLTGGRHPTGWPGRAEPPFRVSADGRRIGVARAGPRAGAGVVLEVNPDGEFAPLPLLPADVSPGHVTPSPDGRWVYTAFGPYRLRGGEYRPLIQVARDRPSPVYSFPTAHGSDLFLSLQPTNDPQRVTGPLRVHLAGSTNRVAELNTLGAKQQWDRTDADTHQPLTEERIHLWPAAGLLAVLTAAQGQTTIEMFKVDLAAELRKSGKDYRVFGSDPPTTAVRGATWEYKPVVWSNEPAELKLDTGPVGMRLADGVVRWAVPPDFAGPEVEVQLEAATPGRPGMRTADPPVQKFKLVVTDPVQ